MKQIAQMFMLMLCLLGLAGAHEITFSRVDIHLEPNSTTLNVQLPIKAIRHEQPTLLPETSVALSPALQDTLFAQVQKRLSLGSGVPLELKEIKAVGDTIELALTAPRIAGDVQVQANLFPEDALHKMFVSVYRSGELAGQYALDRQNSSFVLTAPKRPLPEVIQTFIQEGIHHIFIGVDHIAFVLALIILGGTLSKQIKIITAFTLAHSITLMLAALDVIVLPSALVESVIALSIVVVGLHDILVLRGRKTVDGRVWMAFGFGLIHGFGFASVLKELDLPREALTWALLAFNGGVELGQVMIIVLVLPVLWGLQRMFTPRVYRGVLQLVALGIVVLGVFWLGERLAVN